MLDEGVYMCTAASFEVLSIHWIFKQASFEFILTNNRNKQNAPKQIKQNFQKIISLSSPQDSEIIILFILSIDR